MRNLSADQSSPKSHRPRLRLSNAPLRIASGAYILNSGITHFEERDRAADLHKAAQSTYPPLGSIEPDKFILLFAGAETTLGAALLLPFVSSKLAGLGLAGFSSALLGMYWRDERFRRSSTSLRPSREGESLLKDAWMLGIALALLLQRRPAANR